MVAPFITCSARTLWPFNQFHLTWNTFFTLLCIVFIMPNIYPDICHVKIFFGENLRWWIPNLEICGSFLHWKFHAIWHISIVQVTFCGWDMWEESTQVQVRWLIASSALHFSVGRNVLVWSSKQHVGTIANNIIIFYRRSGNFCRAYFSHVKFLCISFSPPAA